jgi:hypothetical protein
MPSRATIDRSLYKKLIRAGHLKAESLHAWVEPLDALGWRIALNMGSERWQLSEQAKADMT